MNGILDTLSQSIAATARAEKSANTVHRSAHDSSFRNLCCDFMKAVQISTK
jgi:hypothetical protein